MNIGIIGSGNMGRAIGVRLAQLGHRVFFGSRRPDQGRSAADLAGINARSGSNEDACRYGEALLWTMRETQPEQVLDDPRLLDGKVVIDINNRDYANDTRAGGWFERAIAEQLQENVPQAFVVKAFNTIAMETFGTSSDLLRSAGAQTFIAGGNAEAKAVVSQLCAELGFEPIDLGIGPSAMRAAEALGDVIRMLMIDRARGGRAHLRVDFLPEPDGLVPGQRAPSAYT